MLVLKDLTQSQRSAILGIVRSEWPSAHRLRGVDRHLCGLIRKQLGLDLSENSMQSLRWQDGLRKYEHSDKFTRRSTNAHVLYVEQPSKDVIDLISLAESLNLNSASRKLLAVAFQDRDSISATRFKLKVKTLKPGEHAPKVKWPL